MALDYAQWALENPGKTVFDFQDAQRHEKDEQDDPTPTDDSTDGEDEDAERQEGELYT